MEDLVRAIVREELARTGLVDIVYRSTGPLPPGCSRPHFARVCRELGIGARDGAIWSIPAHEWRAARETKATPRPLTKVAHAKTPEIEADEDAQVDAFLSASGFRVGRGDR